MSSSLRTFLIILAFILGLVLGRTAFGQTRPQIELLVTKAALENGIDPNLALAIMEVESSGNVNAVGSLGEQGLFQLRPEFHRGVRKGDARGNIRIALAYLSHLRSRCAPHYGDAFFVCFNTGESRRLKDPRKSSYYKKVMARLQRKAPHVASN